MGFNFGVSGLELSGPLTGGPTEDSDALRSSLQFEASSAGLLQDYRDQHHPRGTASEGRGGDHGLHQHLPLPPPIWGSNPTSFKGKGSTKAVLAPPRYKTSFASGTSLHTLLQIRCLFWKMTIIGLPPTLVEVAGRCETS